MSNSTRQVMCPMFLLHGSDDRMVPLAWGEELAELIPTAQKYIIPGGATVFFMVLLKGDRQ